MVIYVDTRQKAGKHDTKHRQLEELGHVLVRKKLDVGDYASDGCSCVVDTKRSAQELYMDLISEKSRFFRECRKAGKAGMELVILTEDPSVGSLLDLISWTSRYGSVSGEILRNRAAYFTKHCRTKFVFCRPEETGKMIAEFLGG